MGKVTFLLWKTGAWLQIEYAYGWHNVAKGGWWHSTDIGESHVRAARLCMRYEITFFSFPLIMP